MQIQNPSRYQRFMDLEIFIQNYIANQNNSNQRLINPNGIITIPVVVHVLHRGEAVGTGRNISMAQIQSQIDVLNEDFRRLNADRVNTPAAFIGVASDYLFEFRLACQDSAGNVTNGVVRKLTSQTGFYWIPDQNNEPDENGMGIKMTNRFGSDPWPTNRYLNIWVCDFVDGTLGYSTFPADYNSRPRVDGVVIETTALGRVGNVVAPFDKGRTATHEIGHWLNLFHIWGDDYCGNDFVDDTPEQYFYNTGCPAFPHPSNCSNNGSNGDMFMNYMDYTDDPCMNIFTNGQRLRGKAIFSSGGPRNAFIDNYFSITNPGSINCTGTIILNNPNCLTPTWTIVSGPAIITSGQGTNQISLSASGTGNVTVSASAGNYIHDITFSINNTPPLQGYYIINSNYHQPFQRPLYTNNSPIWLPANQSFGVTAYVTNPNPISPSWTRAASNYLFSWSSSGVQLNFSGTSGSTAFNQRNGIFNFTANTGCGTATTTFTWPVIVQGWGFRLSANPNPASDNLIVSITDESKEVKALSQDETITMTLYNLNSTFVVKRWTFKNNQSKFNLNISDVKLGHYILVVQKGKYQQSEQIIIE